MLWFSKSVKRATGYTSVFLLAFNGFVPSIVQAADDAQRAQEFADAMEANMTAIEDSDRDAPRDRWDPAYVVQTVGVDPAALFAWQRANVSWVPYRGSLRGAAGVLMDRRGNSLDQAILLSTLLRQAGKTVRLAHADLSPVVVNAVYQRIAASQLLISAEDLQGPLSTAQAAGAADTYAGSEDFTNTADAYGIDKAKVAASMKSSVTRANAIATLLDQRGRDQGARLLAVAGLPDMATARKTLEGETRAALADHWWVQMASAGAWTDLDVLAPGNTMGSALAPATGSVDPDSLADGFKHTVTVRVIADQWKGGKTAEHVALEQTLAARNLIGTRIQLMHSPSSWPPNWPQTTPDDVQIKLRAAVYTQSEWLPVLLVGERTFTHSSIRDIGEVNDRPSTNNPFRDISTSAVGAVQKAADTLATIADPTAKLPENKEAKIPNAPRAEGELVAEWIEFEIRAPGSRTRKIRRQIFDLLGPAARSRPDAARFMMSEEKKLARATVMLEQTEIMIQPAAMAPEYVTHLVAQNALANKDVFDELSSDPFSKIPKNYLELFSKLVSMPASLYAFASMRLESNPQAGNLFMDRPLIVLQHGGLRRGGGGDFYVRYSLDIVDNAIGVDPRARGNPAELRLRQGVIDSNAEGQALRLAGMPIVTSTGDAFAVKTGRAWSTLKPGAEAQLPALKASADVSARLLSDLKGGNVVVSLANPGPGNGVGWWRIDPVTGTTLGMGPEGNGQALVEYALVMILQGIINGAQCLVAGALRAATERTLKDLDVIEGAKAGVEQAGKSWKDAKADGGRKCIAVGMMGAVDAGLMFGTFALAKRMARGAPPPGPPGNEAPNSQPKPPPEPGNNEAAARAERAAAEAKQQSEMAKTMEQQAEQKVEEAKKSADEARKSSDEALKRAQESQKQAPDQRRNSVDPNGTDGPYRSDPAGRDMLGENQSLARDAIGPLDRIDQADAQAKKSWERGIEMGLNPKDARKMSESSWWDSYKNYHDGGGAPPQSSPPSGAGRSPLANSTVTPANAAPQGPQPAGPARVTPEGGTKVGVNPFGTTQFVSQPAPPTTAVPLSALSGSLSQIGQ